MGLFAAVMLISGFSSVPAVSAASKVAPTKAKSSTQSIDHNKVGDDNVNSNEETQQTTLDDQASDAIEKVIADGMKYTGTPYEFGSSRSTSTTFDCSDFIRWIFKESIGTTLPADSRQQGAFVKNNGTAETDWKNLKRGDLMFFMSYKGSSAAGYKDIDKSTARITHVGIYLGDGKILHTYSNASGGVHVGEFTNTQWEHRFLFGGSVL